MFAVSLIIGNNIKSLVCLWMIFWRVKFIDFSFSRIATLFSQLARSLAFPLSRFAVTFISWFDFRMLFFLSMYTYINISAKFLRAHIRACVPVCYACSNVDIIYIFSFFSIIQKRGAHMRAKDRASLPKHTLFWNVIGITLTTRTYGYNRVAASCFQRFANVVFSFQNRCIRNMRYDRFIDSNRCDNRNVLYDENKEKESLTAFSWKS